MHPALPCRPSRARAARGGPRLLALPACRPIGSQTRAGREGLGGPCARDAHPSAPPGLGEALRSGTASWQRRPRPEPGAGELSVPLVLNQPLRKLSR
uniref:Uncharacterized protein n=1 Tax=Rangifer tarandus platyrhynchus TaxID=3082113 RepID=A0ACB0FGN2_RANTA|nr:unnamed protein product [Rangifer tarandus platyrhynchus]